MKAYLNTTFYNSITSAQPNGAFWDSKILSHSWYNADQSVDMPFTLTEEPKTSHTEESKIGLMYATDYINAYGTSTSNWLFIKNGWSTNSTLSGLTLYEWTLSRYGLVGGGPYSAVWCLVSNGYLTYNESTAAGHKVRPVFYVSPNITLTGEGTTDNPFIINKA